jgi:hypothetical protein
VSAPSDRSGSGLRPRPVLGTQQRDAERDPGALEDEEVDVVDRIDIERDRGEDARRSDERQHPRGRVCRGAPAARGRRSTMSFHPRLVSRRLPPRKIGMSEKRDEGVLVGKQDYRQENRDRIEELRQEFQQRQEAVEAVMEEMRQDIEKRAEEHPYARVSETASLGVLIADAIRQSGREIALAIRETAQMREG